MEYDENVQAMVSAAPGVTATSGVNVPTVGGMISSRRVARAWFDVESVPSPSTGMLMFATVFAALMSTSIGSFMTPLSIARHLSWPIASCTAGASTFGAFTTTLAPTSVPGNASVRRL